MFSPCVTFFRDETVRESYIIYDRFFVVEYHHRGSRKNNKLQKNETMLIASEVIFVRFRSKKEVISDTKITYTYLFTYL